MAPIRHVAPGGGAEFEVDPTTGHAAWRVGGRRVDVARARAVAGDAAVDQILRTAVAQLRAAAAAADEEGPRLRSLAGGIWRERHGASPTAGEGPTRLF